MSREGRGAILCRKEIEMKPFLTLVIAGYATFMLVLGTYWLRGVLDERRRTRSVRAGSGGESGAD
jgi:hypothetical protein